MNPQAKRTPADARKPAPGAGSAGAASAVANPLAALHDYGQAPWLDFLARGFIAQGGLEKLVRDDGLTGVTSNPSIFEKAIGGSDEYDSSLREILSRGDLDVMTLYERLAIEDIRNAADVLRPVFTQTKRADGYVSLEVSPYLAMSTQATIAEARRLWGEVARDKCHDQGGAGRPAPGCRRSASSSPMASTSTSRCCSPSRSMKRWSRPIWPASSSWWRRAATPERSPASPAFS